MSNLNKIVLVGKLTDNPQAKSSGDGTSMAKYILAVDRPRRADGSAGETDFIDIVSWGKQADLAKDTFKKGAMVVVEGRIQVRTYEENGRRKWATEVVSTNLVMLGALGNTAAAAEAVAENKEAQPVPAEEDIPF